MRNLKVKNGKCMRWQNEVVSILLALVCQYAFLLVQFLKKKRILLGSLVVVYFNGQIVENESERA